MNREQRQESWAQHKALAEAAHERDDIPEANYQYGWVAALEAVDGCPQCRQRRKWSCEGFWYHTETGLAACEAEKEIATAGERTGTVAELLYDGATAVDLWLSGAPVPIFPEDTVVCLGCHFGGSGHPGCCDEWEWK